MIPVQRASLADYCRGTLGDPRTWDMPHGYPDGLALSIVDAIQSVGVGHPSVERVIERYRSYRGKQGGYADRDGVHELLATFDELGGPEAWSGVIGNLHRTSSHRGAPLKSEAILGAATALAAEGITSTDDLKATANDPEVWQRVGAAWRGVPGQFSGVSWGDLHVLAGVADVGSDRMNRRFVAGAMGLQPDAVAPDAAKLAVGEAARVLAVQQVTLDHAIWRWERSRHG